MKIEVLVSTMHRDSPAFLNKMGITTPVLAVNQCDTTDTETLTLSSGVRATMYSTPERGLSNSRNMALDHSAGDICMIADDDLTYRPGYEKLIRDSYEKHPDADIICFQFNDQSAPLKAYPKEGGRVGYLRAMQITSFEITFKRASILKKGIRFHPLFGAGSVYPNGEENIFLYRCLDAGLRVYYVPRVLGALTRERPSTWFKGFDREYFRTKGAVFEELSHRFSFPLILQFTLRKHSLYRERYSVWQVLGYLLEGRKAHREGTV